jgi:hypothetical protein
MHNSGKPFLARSPAILLPPQVDQIIISHRFHSAYFALWALGDAFNAFFYSVFFNGKQVPIPYSFIAGAPSLSSGTIALDIQ